MFTVIMKTGKSGKISFFQQQTEGYWGWTRKLEEAAKWTLPMEAEHVYNTCVAGHEFKFLVQIVNIGAV